MAKVALVIIYNHRYDDNIKILERIYKGRFSHIYHLIPFYDGDKSNVIPVYENSYYFQGYLSQGLKAYLKEDYDHYFFVADDMMINPIINEENYKEHLNLELDSNFFPELISFHKRKECWHWARDAFRYNVKQKGIEVIGELPNYEEAKRRFTYFGLDLEPLHYQQIWNIERNQNQFSKRKYLLSYPLVGGYSDMFVISSKIIKKFCHYCGVFAATRLFVEIAVPTALVLSATVIVQEKDIELGGKALWANEDYMIFKPYDKKLEKLLTGFPEKLLYLHPVKLSKWDTTLWNKPEMN